MAFYAPWGNLAIYYRDAPPASGVVVLGRLADGGADVLATAERVAIELVP
ncbi:cyclophilin-like fold protein [Amycolatopsis mediterranei]